MVMVLAPSKSRARVVPIRDTDEGDGLDLDSYDGSDAGTTDEDVLEVSEAPASDAVEEHVEA
jgi:hypothetical protein